MCSIEQCDIFNSHYKGFVAICEVETLSLLRTPKFLELPVAPKNVKYAYPECDK